MVVEEIFSRRGIMCKRCAQSIPQSISRSSDFLLARSSLKVSNFIPSRGQGSLFNSKKLIHHSSRNSNLYIKKSIILYSKEEVARMNGIRKKKPTECTAPVKGKTCNLCILPISITPTSRIPHCIRVTQASDTSTGHEYLVCNLKNHRQAQKSFSDPCLLGPTQRV